MKVILFAASLFLLIASELISEPFKNINSLPLNLNNANLCFLNRVIKIEGELFNYSIVVDSNCCVQITSYEKNLNYLIPIPQELKIKAHYNCGASLISDIVYRNDTLVFVFNHYLLIFKNNKANFFLSQILNLHDYFRSDINHFRGRLWWMANSIFCIKDNQSSVKPSFYLWSIDLTNTDNKNFKELEEPNDFMLTIMQPKRITSLNDKLFITAKPSEYKIYFYSNKFEVIDSISKSKQNWEYIEEKLDLDPNNDTKINACKILYHSPNYFFLHFVDLINDKIMVCYSYLDSNDVLNDERFHFYYDIWSLQNGKWKILYEDLDNNTMTDKNGKKMKLENSYTIFENQIYNYVIDFKTPENSKMEVYQIDD